MCTALLDLWGRGHTIYAMHVRFLWLVLNNCKRCLCCYAVAIYVDEPPESEREVSAAAVGGAQQLLRSMSNLLERRPLGARFCCSG